MVIHGSDRRGEERRSCERNPSPAAVVSVNCVSEKQLTPTTAPAEPWVVPGGGGGGLGRDCAHTNTALFAVDGAVLYCACGVLGLWGLVDLNGPSSRGNPCVNDWEWL